MLETLQMIAAAVFLLVMVGGIVSGAVLCFLNWRATRRHAREVHEMRRHVSEM